MSEQFHIDLPKGQLKRYLTITGLQRWFVGYVILALVGGFVVASLYDRDYFLGGVAATFGLCVAWQIWVSSISANRTYDLRIKAMDEISSKLNGDVGYYSTGGGMPIATDGSNTRFAVSDGGAVSFCRKIDDVVQVSVLTQGSGQIEIYGRASLQAHRQVREANLRSQREAALNTGLLLEFDDIDMPTFLVVMPEEVASKWAVLFNKYWSGSLEPVSRRLVSF